MEITITNKQRKYPLDLKRIRNWAQAILLAQDEENAEVGLVFVGDHVIRQYNQQYRDVDAPTDVLAFPMEPFLLPTGLPVPTGNNIGDVMISLERADTEAVLFGRGYTEHLFCLLVHGLLHLLGYDHEQSRSEAVKMRRREKVLFERCYKKGGEK